MIRFSSLSVPVLAGALVTTALPAQAHHWSSGHYNRGPALRPQMVQSYPYEPAPYPYERSQISTPREMDGCRRNWNAIAAEGD